MRDRLRPAGAAVLAAALLASPPLAAHDLWIVPSSFTPAVGEPVRLRLVLGDGEGEEAVARPPAGSLVRFEVLGPAGSAPVTGLDGVDPAGFLRFARPGWQTVVLETVPAFATLDAEAVRAYLLEEGLTPPRAAGRPAEPAVHEPVEEHFRRSLKARIFVAPADGREGGEPPPPEEPVGLPLELVLERLSPAFGAAAPAGPHCFAGPRSMVTIRLLHEGEPLSGALVDARRLEGGPDASSSGGHTDREGRLRLVLGPGSWLLTTVHLEAASSAIADWASVWASLTFELSPSRALRKPGCQRPARNDSGRFDPADRVDRR